MTEAATVKVPMSPPAGSRTDAAASGPGVDQMLATLAHELGTPLSAITCAARAIALQTDRVVTTRAALLIEQNARHIALLMADLLTCSCLEAGREPRVQGTVNLCSVLRDAIATTEHEVLKRGQVLRVVLPMAQVHVRGDATRLRQAFINLLANASRYTDDGGRLFVSAEVQRDTVCVRIRDTGAGIEADALPRLFDLFYRGDEARRRCSAGHGIGLAVVASVVAAHGGVVSVLSAGPGRGSEFTVELPL